MIEKAKDLLARLWQEIESTHIHKEENAIPDQVLEAIQKSIDSTTKSYRYVLPTHLLAKAVNPDIDARAVQESSDLAGSFDARSFCRATIVPFDRENHNVLGGSGDPYVSNPLRIPAITKEQLQAQRNKQGFEDLIEVSFPRLDGRGELVEDGASFATVQEPVHGPEDLQ